MDHLVVAARSLQAGRAWLEGRLGVPLQPGGEHETFGTHNALLSLGPGAYLEVIAVNPAAPRPQRPRWFALDTPELNAKLRAGPQLIHWVAAVQSPLSGALELSRGANRWQLIVPDDGSLPTPGAAPTLIHWRTPPPPTTLPDAGVRLLELQLGTPEPDRLRGILNGLNFHGDVTVYDSPQVELKARLETPSGLVDL
ncbi:VOC family protein [Deinococcus cavernae]|uniref:VOC family protein n=1 Tax=Deinococcus cavernae TaxID=2320857 RepID=A0A418V776_9DEIO|nr:VOC family protein [Deinococcus cavernae]RJF71968.1 VOC family protein [Deinococcus cavernae]